MSDFDLVYERLGMELRSLVKSTYTFRATPCFCVRIKKFDLQLLYQPLNSAIQTMSSWKPTWAGITSAHASVMKI